MAIAKICSVSGNSAAVLTYVLEQKDKKLPEEQKAEIIQANNLFGDIKDMSNQMAMFQEERPNCKNNVLHLALSFDPNERLTAIQAEKAINTLLEEVGITKEDHQYVVVEHKDAAHQHFHIVASRVGMDASLLSDSHLKVRLNVICDKIEKEQELLPTPGRQWKYDPSSQKGYKFVKAEKFKVPKAEKYDKLIKVKTDIRRELETVLSKTEIQTPDQLLQALKVKGIELNFTENKNGISGVSFRADDIAVKGSAVGYKWNEINKALETNKEQSQTVEPAPLSPYATVLRLTEENIHEKEKEPVTEEKAPVKDEEVPEQLIFPDLPIQTSQQRSDTTEQEIHKLNLEKIKFDKQQWEDAKRRKPEPTEEERKDINVVEAYNSVVKAVIDHFKDTVSKGDTSYDLVGTYKLTVDNWIDPKQDRLNLFMKEDLPLFRKAQEDLDKDYKHYQQDLTQYHALQEQQPEKAGFWASGQTRAEIAQRNLQLSQYQSKAIKPEFKTVIKLDHRSLEKKSAFSTRLQEWEITKRLKEKGVIEKEKTQVRIVNAIKHNMVTGLPPEILGKMQRYIENNPEKLTPGEQVVDQAIRIYMKEIKPDQNSWATWSEYYGYEKLRTHLNEYADQVFNNKNDQYERLDPVEKRKGPKL
jgi:hypothetical protein